MSRVAIVGAGAGGAAAAVDLTLRGHDVALWSRSRSTLEHFRERGGVAYEGVLGCGEVRPARITSDLAEALRGVDAAVICLPSLAHEAVGRALADAGMAVPLVLNPGHTCGALHLRAIFSARGCKLPPTAELSTLTYVARKHEPSEVTISGAAGRVRGAHLPGGEEALEVAASLWPCVEQAADVLATGLANVNLVLHPPGAVLAAAWVEATEGDFRFYVDAMTPGVTRVLERLDDERRAVARALGHDLPPLLDEMAAIGTVARDDARSGDVRAAISRGRANRSIRGPGSLDHRYYREDFPYGIVPLIALGRLAGTTTLVAEALLQVAQTATGEDLSNDGLTAERLGIAGLDRDGLRRLVTKGGS